MIPFCPPVFRPAFLAAVLCLLAAGCGEPPGRTAVGTRLATLPIAPIGDLAAAPPTLEGRVTLLNFWGTWCPPCRRELPGLARTARGLADDRRFQLVAVSCAGGGIGDPAALAAEAAEFLAGQRLAIPAYVITDPVSADALAATIGLRALPATYLVGPDARIRRIWIGYRPRDEAEIAAAIVSLLKELPSRPADQSASAGGVVQGSTIRTSAPPSGERPTMMRPP